MKQTMQVTGLLLGLSLWPFFAGAAGRQIDLDLKGRAVDPYDKALFKLWQPDEVKQFRAVVLIAAPMPVLNEGQWQDLADRTDSALLFYNTLTTEETRMRNNERGRNRAEDHGGQIDEALAALAQKTGHAELKTAPVAIWALTSMFGPTISYFDDHNDRVICYFVSQPVRFGPSLPKLQVATKKVPCFISTSSDALMTWAAELSGLVEDWRKRNAPWCFVTDRSTNVLSRQLSPLAMAYIEACIKLRVPAASGLAGHQPLREVDQSRGWLVERETLKTYPQAAFTKSKEKAGWLPDQATAELWELTERGKLNVKRDPPRRP